MKINQLKKSKKANLAVVFAFFAFLSGHTQSLLPITEVNSEYDEIHPILSPLGDLFFTRTFHPDNLLGSRNPGDIWQSEKRSTGDYAAAQRISSLSTEGFDAVIGFPTSDQILIYHSYPPDGQGIYRYQKEGDGWGNRERLVIPGLRTIGTHLFGRLSANGNAIVISMNSYDSQGNEDLYLIRKLAEDRWSRPLHLGPEINTPFQELTPFLSEDQQILFFSSNGHGKDKLKRIYFSVRLDETYTRWSPPKMVEELETFGVTLSYFSDYVFGTTILTSTTSSEGYGDIFIADEEMEQVIKKELASFNITTDTLITVGSMPENRIQRSPLIDSETIEPFISSYDSSDKPTDFEEIEPLKEDPIRDILNSVQNFRLMVSSDSSSRVISGLSEYDSIAQGKSIAGVLLVPGYFPYRVDVSSGALTVSQLRPADTGYRWALENLEFERGSTRLIDSVSVEEIRVAVEFLDQNPDLIVRLEGHTDSYGNVELNKQLSLERADEVRRRLIERGIAFERIRVSGFGGTRPIGDNRTEQGRAMNRRVELVIVENY